MQNGPRHVKTQDNLLKSVPPPRIRQRQSRERGTSCGKQSDVRVNKSIRLCVPRQSLRDMTSVHLARLIRWIEVEKKKERKRTNKYPTLQAPHSLEIGSDVSALHALADSISFPKEQKNNKKKTNPKAYGVVLRQKQDKKSL